MIDYTVFSTEIAPGEVLLNNTFVVFEDGPAIENPNCSLILRVSTVESSVNFAL
jgi:hypothetical protein